MPISPKPTRLQLLAARLRLISAPRSMATRALLHRHRRSFDVVGGAGRHLGVDQPVALAEIMRHAGIDDRQKDPVVPREHVDRGAAVEKVFDHLPGHFLRIGRNARLRGAMIAGEDQQMRLVKLGIETLLDQADLPGDRFELTESPERLGLPVDLVLQGGGQPLVGGGDVETEMHPILPVNKSKRASRRRS
jgi:hypothetical protein